MSTRDEQAENTELRTMLWLNHGCDFKHLYGDDGNMQCSRCFIDFKRDSVESIKDRWRKRAATGEGV